VYEAALVSLMRKKKMTLTEKPFRIGLSPDWEVPNATFYPYSFRQKNGSDDATSSPQQLP
jgi:hypothetical protein